MKENPWTSQRVYQMVMMYINEQEGGGLVLREFNITPNMITDALLICVFSLEKKCKFGFKIYFSSANL